MKARILGLSAVVYALVSATATADMKIATASKEGVYYPVGEAIAKILAAEEPAIKVEVVPSEGSVDNIGKLLKDGEFDLAIIQSDVLKRAKEIATEKPDPDTLSASEKELYAYREEIDQIRSLMALFPEYVQIVVRKDSGIRSLLKLHGKKIYLGKPKSGTRYNAGDILSFLEIDTGDYEDVMEVDGREIDTATAKQLLTQERPDGSYAVEAVFSTSGTVIRDPELRHLTLKRELASEFRKAYDYYDFEEVDLDGSQEANLIFTRANLVARSSDVVQGLSDREAELIVRGIYENQFDLSKNLDDGIDIELFVGDRLVRRVTDDLHPGAERYFKGANVIPHIRLWERLIIAISIFVGLTIVIVKAFRRSKLLNRFLQSRLITGLYKRGSRFQKAWDRYIRLTCSTLPRVFCWLFGIVFVGVVYFIQHLEKTHSVANDVENPFAGSSFFDAAGWLLTFAVTGFHQNIYPNTFEAKALAVAVPVLGILLAIFVLVTKTFRAELDSERQAQGFVIPTRLKNHILICGFNDRVKNLLHDLTSASSFLPADGRVVVIAEHDDERPLQGFDLDRKRVCYVRGRSSDYEILKKLNLDDAIGAIVVAGNKKVVDNNHRSILTCTAIRNSLPIEKRTEFPIIAELFYERNRPFFETSGVDKLVCLKTVSVRMITHAALNPGISELLVSLMTFSTEQVAHAIGAREPEKGRNPVTVVGKSLGAALKDLRAADALLLGVCETTKGAGDVLEVEFREDSPYHFGPEFDYVIKETDRLIVAERNRKPDEGDVEFLSKKTAARFDYGNEVVLMIGNSWAGDETAGVLAKRAKEVIQLIPEVKLTCPDEHPIEEKHDGNITILRTPLEADENFYREHADRFGSVTRAVILGPDRNQNATESEIFQDDGTIMHAKTLKRVAPGVFAEVDSFHILAEMRCIDNLDLFQHSGIDQPVPTTKLIEQCLAQMVFHRGVVSEFLLKAMSYSPSNKKGRLKRMSARALVARLGEEVIGSTFDALLNRCMGHRIQLVGIQPTTAEGLPCPLIVNPFKPEERGYQLDHDDFVFVFVKPSDSADDEGATRIGGRPLDDEQRRNYREKRQEHRSHIRGLMKECAARARGAGGPYIFILDQEQLDFMDVICMDVLEESHLREVCNQIHMLFKDGQNSAIQEVIREVNTNAPGGSESEVAATFDEMVSNNEGGSDVANPVVLAAARELRTGRLSTLVQFRNRLSNPKGKREYKRVDAFCHDHLGRAWPSGNEQAEWTKLHVAILEEVGGMLRDVTDALPEGKRGDQKREGSPN